ncbi:putative bacteroidetes VLRF1 release factor [Leishmania naiffi]|uniref:Bacteroidetes VLRF1 release factor n=1 Tax=Leishmania naiffi TaxID=5678 RepID=A0AAW3BAG3_9TRYP
MLLSAAEKKITAVLQSLRDTPRTPYEVENLYQLNCERIATARAALADMSGDYIDKLRARCMEAEQRVQAKRAAGVVETAAADTAFSLDFAIEETEGQNDAEIQSAMEAVAHGSRRPKKSNEKGKLKKQKDGEEGHKKKGRQTPADEPFALSHLAGCGSGEDNAVVTATSSCLTKWVVLSRDNNLISSEVPSALSSSGRGRCEAVPNTSLARAFFTEEMSWDGVLCVCAVELYRCVVIALTYGEPQLSWAECEKRVKSQEAVASKVGAITEECFSSHTAKCEDLRSPNKFSDDDGEDTESDSSSAVEDMTLSEKLIAEYHQAQQAEEEHEADTLALPRDVSERFQQRLRGFTEAMWVILLCHGGYFAGGVFAGGTCVAHKAFQRYVVRKKQGGKQSSNAKDAGSYNSVGSQIRAAQEVKWRVDVRDILVDWTPYIQAASFILYAAPGPQNRAVLTDFSLLPAMASVGGRKCDSPIQLKDPRVSRVPLTTHRPTFEEVRRIYGVCSHCSLLYVREEDA